MDETHSRSLLSSLLGGVVALAAVCGLAEAQSVDEAKLLSTATNDADFAQPATAKQLKVTDEVVVIGSNIRGVQNTASPVLSFGRADIEKSGFTSLSQFIQSLPQNFGGGDSETTIGGFLGGSGLNVGQATGANLRGLGNNSTLTLVNGRRVAPVGYGDAVDLSVIPLAAVERIDVLTDGASAIYGADAVAGVVNITLKKNYEGAETHLHYGDVTSGSNGEVKAGQTLGTKWNSGSLLASYEYDKRNALGIGARDATRDAPYPGLDLIPPNHQQSALVSISQDAGTRVQLYGDALFSRRNTLQEYVSGVPYDSPISVDQYTSSAGGRIDLGHGWQADIGTAYSYNTTQYTLFAAGTLATSLDMRSDVWSNDIKVDGTIFDAPGGEAKLAVGTQYRRETFNSRGSTQNTGGVMQRHVSAEFTELFMPFVGDSNRYPGLERLALSLAARHEDYSDVGSTANPKYGLLWTPVQGVSLRGTYGTSFRAPSLYELSANAFPLEPIAYTVSDPQPGNPANRSQAIVIVGNNSHLKPEKSTSWTAGLDIEPEALPKFKASLTYFNYDFRDRIAVPIGAAAYPGILSDEAQHPTLVTRNPGLAAVQAYLTAPNFRNNTIPQLHLTPADISAIVDNQEANVASVLETGLDFNFVYGFDTAAGNFDVQANGSYLFEKKDRLTSGSPYVEELNTVFNPVDLRLRNSLTWSRGGLSATIFLNYVNSYHDGRPGLQGDVASWTTFDSTVSYDTGEHFGWLENATLSLTILNALNRGPPYINNHGLNVDATNASVVGRYVSLDIIKRFGNR